MWASPLYDYFMQLGLLHPSTVFFHVRSPNCVQLTEEEILEETMKYAQERLYHWLDNVRNAYPIMPKSLCRLFYALVYFVFQILVNALCNNTPFAATIWRTNERHDRPCNSFFVSWVWGYRQKSWFLPEGYVVVGVGLIHKCGNSRQPKIVKMVKDCNILYYLNDWLNRISPNAIVCLT